MCVCVRGEVANEIYFSFLYSLHLCVVFVQCFMVNVALTVANGSAREKSYDAQTSF